MTPLSPGNGDQDGTSAATKLGAIGAQAQRAPRLIGAPEVPEWGAAAVLEGRSGRPRLSIVPPLPESGWLDQDEDGEPRGVGPIGKVAITLLTNTMFDLTCREFAGKPARIGSYPQARGRFGHLSTGQRGSR